jgi:pimeloyl-ACP methyl ester carboxylesterase
MQSHSPQSSSDSEYSPLEISLPIQKLVMRGWQNRGKKDLPSSLAPGAPVIFLHGWLDNVESFRPLLPKFGDYHWYAFDWPGHGQSDHFPLSVEYNMRQYMVCIMEALNELKLEKVHVVAHSLGACVATLLAAVYPEKFASCVLIEGFGPLSSPESELPARYREAIDAILKTKTRRDDKNSNPSGGGNGNGSGSGSAIGSKKKRTSFDESERESMIQLRAQISKLSLPLAKIIIERNLIHPEENVYQWRSDGRLKGRSPHPFNEEQVRQFLLILKTPTLFIKGESTEWKSNEQVLQERLRLCPKVKIVQLPGGHHLHMENPDEMAKVIFQFYQYS